MRVWSERRHGGVGHVCLWVFVGRFWTRNFTAAVSGNDVGLHLPGIDGQCVRRALSPHVPPTCVPHYPYDVLLWRAACPSLTHHRAYWMSPVTYVQQALSINEMGHSRWQSHYMSYNGKNMTVGDAVLESYGLYKDK